LAILGKPESWHVQQLAAAAHGLGYEVLVAPFQELVGGVGGPPTLNIGSTNLLEFPLVLVRGIPPGTLEQVVFRMDALHRLERAGVTVINPPRAIETCVDKYLASSLIHQSGLPTPRTIVCDAVEPALRAFHELGRHIVVKPIFGSEGRGIIDLADETTAGRVFQSLVRVGSVLYLQEFVHHSGFDLRLLTVGDNVVAAMKRWNQLDFRTNAARGGTCEPHQPDSEECALGLAAARAVGAFVAGVDLIRDRTGRLMVIEVNSTPGFQRLSECTGVNVAHAIMASVCERRKYFST
jgi:ribosomal protein S6--L-glutamate ligase